MRITRPRATKLSQITINSGLDLSGGDYDILMKVGRTVDGEDVSAHVAAAKPHSEHAIITSGDYAGDDTVNRAIPHGLGRTPKFVYFHHGSTGADAFYAYLLQPAVLIGYSYYEVSYLKFSVTVWDSTNFYVGNATHYGHSMNFNGYGNIYWIAIG